MDANQNRRISSRLDTLSQHLIEPSALEAGKLHISPVSAKVQASPMAIRQVVWVVKDLEPSLAKLKETLNLSDPFRDHEIHLLGLKNGVFVLGNQFLEMICPLEEDNTAAKQLVRRQGDGGYMVMLQTPDFEKDQARLEKEGFQTVLEIQRDEIKEIHLHPKNTSKCILSVSQPLPTPNEWPWGGPEWKQNSPFSQKVAQNVRGVVIQSDDVASTTKQFQKLLGVVPTFTEENEPCFLLKDGAQRLRIVKATDGRGNGLAQLEFTSAGPSKVGTTLTLNGMILSFV